MEPTQEQINAYVAAIIKAGIPVDELIKMLLMLSAYSGKMIAEAMAAIAEQQGQAAIQVAEGAKQKAQAQAAAAHLKYLDVIKAQAVGT